MVWGVGEWRVDCYHGTSTLDSNVIVKTTPRCPCSTTRIIHVLYTGQFTTTMHTLAKEYIFPSDWFCCVTVLVEVRSRLLLRESTSKEMCAVQKLNKFNVWRNPPLCNSEHWFLNMKGHVFNLHTSIHGLVLVHWLSTAG